MESASVPELHRNSPPAQADYSVRLEFDRQERYSRGLIFVKWLLAVPHYFVLMFFGIGAFFAIVAAWFAVLFTGRYPRGLFDFVLGVMRYSTRVTAYAFLLMTDRYPSFGRGEEPDYPVRLYIEYPEAGVSRWRPLFAWLIGLPFLIVASALMSVLQIVVFVAWFAILFTGRFPEGMFQLVDIPMRWQARGNAYAMWMATKYPPFVWG